MKIKLWIALALTSYILSNCDSKTQEKQPAQVENDKNTTSQTSTAPTNTQDAPIITFKEKDFDFGTIEEGSVVKHIFKFTNTGKTPLTITNASAPCGCTVPKWPKEPIAPNADGEIEVEFNSAGKSGMQSKTVKIQANTNPPESNIDIRVMVKPNPEKMSGPVKEEFRN